MNYQEFIAKKMEVAGNTGYDGDFNLSPKLFDFQKSIVQWALRKGRAAIWADCGLGKTFMQIEWARIVNEREGKPIIIFAPLAVSKQTIREGVKLGVDIKYVRDQSQCSGGLNITNYEMLEHFDPSKFGGVVLDESSILKSHTGKFRTLIINSFQMVNFRLACTATPSPNDYVELGNHAEFLGIMTRTEMLCTYFVHDGETTSEWRLKGHAQEPFWKWLASWAVMIRKPSDIGFSDDGFELPKMVIHQHILNTDRATAGFLFAMPAQSLSEQRLIKRESISDRLEKCSELVGKTKNDPCIVWCELNDESKDIAKTLNALEITGSDSPEEKEKGLMDFTDGKERVIVSKVSIAGYGLNWQHCRNMIFVSLSHSYEDFYQAVRRCWRFGQKREVHVHQILMQAEVPILENIQRKQAEADRMSEELVKHMEKSMRENLKSTKRERDSYNANKKIKLPNWIGA